MLARGKVGINVGVNVQKTEMHRLVAMHLRIG